MKKYSFRVRLVFLFVFALCISRTAFGETPGTGNLLITPANQDSVAQKMITTFGRDQETRIRRGLSQTAAFWKKEDGSAEEYEKFCLENFASDPVALKETFKRAEKNFENIQGFFNELTRNLKEPLDCTYADKLPIDEYFGKFSPGDHLQEDLFNLKLAFVFLLNFRQTNLDEKLTEGPKWSREEWRYTRMCDYYPARVPSEINQKLSAQGIESESYVNDYNLFMGYLLNSDKKTLFKEDLKLISHWGLRDHLKLLYSQKDGLPCQEMIYQVMLRIIDQTIPKVAINQAIFWDPFSNKIFDKVGDQFKEKPAEPEKNGRYSHMLANFLVQREADPFYPKYPTYIDRKFNLERQIPEAVVEKVLIDILSAEVNAKLGAFVAKRLGRELKPFDIWYPGFKAGGEIPEAEMNAKVVAKYPNVAAFEKAVPDILTFLGFTPEKAKMLSEHIAVDPARGGGHAMPTLMHSDKSHLRTRVPEKGMDYQGFNTAMHELGHCVEMTFSLFNSDSYMIHDIPNTALTEAFAFVFQDKDLSVLGIKSKDPKVEDLTTLDLYWATYEIAGVSLVDLYVWRWLYKNPQATPDQLREKVVEIAKDVWNKYYAPVFKVKDSPILGIYAHMIAYPLYLADYTVGGVVQFQIQEFLKGKNLGTEMERMLKIGYVTPKQWMENAVGSDLSAKALTTVTQEALSRLQ